MGYGHLNFWAIGSWDMSKLMNTVEKLFDQGLMMDTSTMPQYSAISENSLVKGTPKAIRDWLTSLAEDFRAKTCQLSERDLDSTEKEVDCGLITQEQLSLLSQNSFSLKTCQPYSKGDSGEFWATYPAWGTMLDGAVYQRPPLDVSISERDFGYLPSPRASQEFKPVRAICPTENGRHGKSLSAAIGQMAPSLIGSYMKPTLIEAFMMFPSGSTELQPLETHKYQEWQQQHLEYFRKA